MSKNKKMTISFDNDDSAAGGTVQPFATQPMPIAPMTPGQVVTGAIIPTDLTTISTLVEAEWQLEVQSDIDSITDERKAAVKTAKELEEVYLKATGAVAFPDDFVKSVKKLATAFEPFYGDTAAVALQSRTAIDKHVPTADATIPLTGVSISIGGGRNVVTFKAQIKGDGEQIATVSKEYEADAALVAAYKAKVDAQAEVTKLDARLVELAKLKQQAAERGKTAAAVAAGNVLKNDASGQAILASLGKVVDHMAEKAGLKGRTKGKSGILAITAGKDESAGK